MRFITYILLGVLLGLNVKADTAPFRVFSKVIGDSSNIMTGIYLFPNFTGTHTGSGQGGSVSLGINGIAGGGTNNAGPFTAGSVIFSNGTQLIQDNAKFFWDDTNFRLGINTATPTFSVDVTGTLRTTSTITDGSVAATFAGAPLSINSSQVIVGGITGGKVTSTTADTSTTAFVTMAGMTLTPAAGNYEIIFTTDVNSATAGSTVTIDSFVGTTASEQVKFMPFAGGTLTSGNQRVPVTLNDYVTVNGSQAITIQWLSSTAGCTTAGKRMTYKRLQ